MPVGGHSCFPESRVDRKATEVVGTESAFSEFQVFYDRLWVQKELQEEIFRMNLNLICTNRETGRGSTRHLYLVKKNYEEGGLKLIGEGVNEEGEEGN